MREQIRKGVKGVVAMAVPIKSDVKEEMVKRYLPLVKYIASRVIIGKPIY